MASVLSLRHASVVLEGKTIVEDLTFEVERGDNLTILGPNGSGKTVLLRALLGILPHSGEIVWAPDVKVGYVPQKIDADRHLPLSAGDLLRAKVRTLGLKPKAAREVAEIVGLSPELLGTPVGRLSGGQFQKALIAFALLGDPNVLLLDEPTASLDALAEERVFELIKRLQEQFHLTLIVVSHDLSMVYRYATKVLCLNRQGICFGAPREVLTPAALETLYGAPYHYYQHHQHHHEPGDPA